MKNYYKYLFIALLLLFIGLCIYTKVNSNQIEDTVTIRTDTIHTSDTIILRDTLRIEEPIPHYVEVIRIDTIAQIDTVTVTVQIERKTYEDENYKAVIEGYKPKLLSLDIYKENTTIKESTQINTETNTTHTKKAKWAVTAGTGIGYTPKGVEPYIGVSVGYVLWSK